MVIRIRGGKSIYGALKYNADKEKIEAGQVLLTNEMPSCQDGGGMQQ